MKKLRKISKEYYLRQIMACWMVLTMVVVMPVRIAMADPLPGALPDGFVLVDGTGIPGTTGNTMLIQNISNGAIFRWDGGFNIGELATVDFDFNASGSSALNRDVTGNMSEIYGTLLSNGNVYIVNPAGIVFGGGATVNVNQLVASGLDMSPGAWDDAVLGNDMVFAGGSGDVTVNGTLDATGTDSLYLVGRNVTNNGAILCPGGLVVMAAGDEIHLGQPGSPVIIDAGWAGDHDNDVENNGTVGEAGNPVGTLVLAAGDIWSQAIANVGDLAVKSMWSNIKMDGDIDVTGDMEIQAFHRVEINGNATAGGNMDLKSDRDNFWGDNLVVSGTLTAGGTMALEGQNVYIQDAVSQGDMDIDAHGLFTWVDGTQAGGGDVHIGGTLVSNAGSITIDATEFDYGEPASYPNYHQFETEFDDYDSDGTIYIGNGTDPDPAIDVQAAFDIRLNNYTVAVDGPATTTLTLDAGRDVYIEGGDLLEGGIYATDTANSDAVAEIVVNADNDVFVNADIDAEAWGSGSDNATATIDINAGRDVDVDGDLKAMAHVLEGPDEGVPGNATATIDITAVAGSVDIDDQSVKAIAVAAMTDVYPAGNATANMGITAGQNINIIDSKVYAKATAKDSGNATASVDVIAGDKLKVMAFNGSEALLKAKASDGALNTATVDIDTGGDVLVHGVNGDASIEAVAKNGVDNLATIDIDAVGGDVKVIDIGSGGGNTSKIEAWTQYALNSNTSEITINATATATEYEDEGEETYVEVDGGNVLVKAKEGGNAEILAYAANSEGLETNTANVTIFTTAVELVGVEEVCGGFVYVEGGDSFIVGGDVDVIATGIDTGPSRIQAVTFDGYTNDSDVLICADGEVSLESWGSIGGMNLGGTDNVAIEAMAYDGEINDAYVGIGAGEGVEVIAGGSDLPGSASIAARAFNLSELALSNTAEVVVCTLGGVDVIAEYFGDAGILARAENGIDNNASVGVCAQDDVLVLAGINPEALFGTTLLDPPDGTGGTAMIRADARNGISILEPPSTADADVTVVSHEGGVAVIDWTYLNDTEQQTAGIIAEAHSASSNTASVGVAAYGDLLDSGENIGVLVGACGDNSDARISALAYNGKENTADTVVYTPGTVIVTVENETPDGKAEIKSEAGMLGDEGADNSATTQVYAGEVYVGDEEEPGALIAALSSGSPGDTEIVTNYCLTADGKVAEIDGDAVLIIADYSERVLEDCPDCPSLPEECPGCEEEKEEELLAPVAPLVPYEIPRIEGCPVETAAAAAELGITSDTIQVAIGNALALNPTVQPCQACAALIDAASILRDRDGSRMAAMVAVFNELAPADAPFTPEMGASIATAFEGAEEGTQYASAMEYIDAFVEYVAVLDAGLGAPVGDSVAFVMDKYGTGVTDSDNANISAFVATRLEAIR